MVSQTDKIHLITLKMRHSGIEPSFIQAVESVAGRFHEIDQLLYSWECEVDKEARMEILDNIDRLLENT
ncbi:MAG: hypothetical protein MOGMAGMI_00382 [Candidatus Omnitrophica bacterium]|nr:hypothetical protein [Candidatus Omnitrophota bacterium]